MSPCKIPVFFFTFLVLGLSFSNARAQTEYFVELDAKSGNFTKLNSIPGVNWILPARTTYNAKQSKYYFCGGPESKSWFLYTVDASNGTITNTCRFPVFGNPQSNILNLQFNEADETIYAIHWDEDLKKEFFVTIDPLTGNFEKMNEIPGIRYVSTYSALDISHDEYIVQAFDSTDKHLLYFIDIKTGMTVRSIPTTRWLHKFFYDPTIDKIYAVYSPSDTVKMAVVNRLDGSLSENFLLPGVIGHFWGLDNYCYNKSSNDFYIVTVDSFKRSNLTTINLTSKTVTNSVPFPYANNSGENIICFVYDNTLSKLFALHWDPETAPIVNDKMTVYPNPADNNATVELTNNYTNITILLYDASQRYIGKYVAENTNKVTIDVATLARGLYTAEVFLDHIYFETSKLVLQ